MTGEPTEKGFLSRWSKRKLDGDEPDLDADVAQDTADPGASEPARPQAAPPREGDLPATVEAGEDDGSQYTEEDVEKLQPGDDFSKFLKAAVPEHVQRLAMRKLFRSNPVLANLDGLVDYGEDYRDLGNIAANVKTAWQVGKGHPRPEDETQPAPEEAQCAAEGAAQGQATGEAQGDAAVSTDEELVHEESESEEAGASHAVRQEAAEDDRAADGGPRSGQPTPEKNA